MAPKPFDKIVMSGEYASECFLSPDISFAAIVFNFGTVFGNIFIHLKNIFTKWGSKL